MDKEVNFRTVNMEQTKFEEERFKGNIPEFQKRNRKLDNQKKSSALSLFSKKLKIRVNKPLIPLKGTLLFWFGGTYSILPFLQIFLKQKGLTIAQISYIYIFNPCVQFLGSLISGIIADKIGRTKPVLLGNMILATLSLICMLLIPSKQDCVRPFIEMHCNAGEFYTVDSFETCNSSTTKQCEVQCSSISSDILCGKFNETVCSRRSNNTIVFRDVNISMHVTDNLNNTNQNFACKTDVTFPYQNTTNFCSDINTETCNLTCLENISCNVAPSDNSTFAMAFVLLILFNSTLSNSFRILDVTTMSMVKTYNSDFGRERVWSISGTLIFSIVSGYAVNVATGNGTSKNYNIAIYLFTIMAFLTLLTVWKLEVQIEAPGKRMVKKSLILLKNPDVVTFYIAVMILGTCWCFSKQYSSLYLDGIGASSVLLGLNTALNSLLGLPFLMFSNYWVKKFGSKKILVLGFTGHVVFYVGYAYLKDPWWSLPLEATGIFNYHLLWVGIVRHSHAIAPEGLIATVIATAGALHYGIGKGTASALGGMTMSKYGGPTAYKVMATTSGVTGILYAMYLCIRHLFRKQNFNMSPKARDNE